MKLIRLAAATLNQTPLLWDGNQYNILTAIEQARRHKATVVCLPELCISGYGCEDAFLSHATPAQAVRSLHEIAPATQGMIVAVGLPLLYRNRVYNTACLLVDGNIAGFTAKRFLAGDGIHYEPRWFYPWPEDVRGEIKLHGQYYPIGDIDFDCGGIRIGFEICEEAWVAKRPGIRLAQRGVDIVLNPSASHFAFDKFGVRRRFVLEGSRAFSAAYVYANLNGNESGRVIYDGGCLIAGDGKMLAMGERFSFKDCNVISGVVDLHLGRMKQARTSAFTPNPQSCVRVPFQFPELLPAEVDFSCPRLPSWENSEYRKEEEFTRAEALGLFDYMRKSRSNGFVVSLSGGADSAAVACLVYFMLKLAVRELGVTGFFAKLAYLPPPNLQLKNSSTSSLIGENEPEIKTLLACIYQATRNSSETTRTAAQTLAQTLGADYFEIDIDEAAQTYTTKISAAIGRELTWQNDDLALQNIQARARSPGVWLLANVRNALLLATSNRSEAAVGYATMDGDTSGGLSPLAGIDKHFIRVWLRHVEHKGVAGFAPLSALELVNRQQPTAELRPGSEEQTDENDLMPYDLLNAIEKAAIRDRQSPYEIFCLMRSLFPQYCRDQLLTWIERFFQLWSRNQWKRERYAPAFHLDDENLDPKTWCRFPILSGSFSRELAEMHKKAE